MGATTLLISIIVPVYNANRYLDEGINSILNQSFNSFELLMVNDGSTDDSGRICDEIASTDGRVRVFHKKNGGVTSARKVGWQNSKCKWVVFVDADDVLHADCLDVLYKNAIDRNCDIVNGSFESFPSGRLWRHKTLGMLSQNDYLKSLLLGETYGVLYASLYKREIIKDSSFSFDSSIKIGEDVLTKIEIGFRAKAILNISDVVYDYRDNESSAMNNTILHPSYYDRYHKYKKDLFVNSGLLSTEIKEVLEKEKINSQIDAFFSPYIDFDGQYFNNLNKYTKTYSISNIDQGTTRVFFLALRFKILSKVIKSLYGYAYRLKHRNHSLKNNKKIIY